MDELKDYEINDILDNIEYLDRNQWEQCRVNTYVLAQTHSKKQLKPNDVMKFAWDKKADIEISNSDIDRLKKLAKQYENREYL